MKNKNQATTRPARIEDIDRMIAIHDICFGPPFPQEIRWNREILEIIIRLFPEGQIIAEVGGKIAGHIISSRVSEEHYRSHPPLLEAWNIGFIPDGNTMWILEIAVDPLFKGCSAARALIEGCKQTVTNEPELLRFMAGARIPGYAGWKMKTGGMPEQYCQEVREGRLFDQVLGPFLKYGTVFDCVIDNYIEDPDSLNYGVCVVWEKG